MTSPDYAHHFSANNIPFGIASSEKHKTPQAASRLGNTVIFLNDLAEAGFFRDIGETGLPSGIFNENTLNRFASLPKAIVSGVRRVIQSAIKKDDKLQYFPSGSTEDISSVTMHMPVEVKDFTDFSCSLHHNENMGRIIMGDPSLPPCFFHYPAGYGGRAASVSVSGTPVERPTGKYFDSQPDKPRSVVYGPSKMMDYELEFAAVIGQPLPMRRRLKAVDADQHIFGFVVLNDWSARDIQVLEMKPLGPLNSKNVGTTISPWIVTLEALQPFRAKGPPRQLPVEDYLDDPTEDSYNIDMQVEILSQGSPNGTVTAKSNVKSLYWSPKQTVAHIVSAGSALRTGDLMATGTVSGSEEGTHGCLMESTKGGKTALTLANGEQRTFLQDGDVVRMTAIAGSDDSGVGFGECVGELLPATPFL